MPLAANIFDDGLVARTAQMWVKIRPEKGTRVSYYRRFILGNIDLHYPVIVGMSGGVDSSVTAKLLADQVR